MDLGAGTAKHKTIWKEKRIPKTNGTSEYSEMKKDKEETNG